MALRSVSFAFVILVSACASSPPPVAPPAPPPSGPEPGSPPSGDAPRPSLTAEQCEAEGGSVVGDIGDGAIQRPDYKCPSGAAPRGNIAPPADGPVPIEGAVCCPK